MKGLSQLMRQAQEMQANMQKAQDELAATEVEGVAGGGMVKVIVTCKHEVRRVMHERVPGFLDGGRGAHARAERREPLRHGFERVLIVFDEQDLEAVEPKRLGALGLRGYAACVLRRSG